MLQCEPLILASASQIRKQLLLNAGLNFEVHPANLDEAAIKQSFLDNNSDPRPADVAQLLAQTKASVIAEQHPSKLVIGSDQILVHEGQIVSKPTSKDEALDQLIGMRGKTHDLVSAVAASIRDQIVWSYEDVAHLTMREVSNKFLGTYLADMGDTVTQTVGAYQLEGLGIHLFDKVEGDYFTVLGLPMLPLLDFLRSRNEQLA